MTQADVNTRPNRKYTSNLMITSSASPWWRSFIHFIFKNFNFCNTEQITSQSQTNNNMASGHIGRFLLWISLRMTSLLKQSDIPLSANTDPVMTQHNDEVNVRTNVKAVYWGVNGNIPLLLVPSLMTEELREVKWDANVLAVPAAVFRLLRVADRLNSVEECIRDMMYTQRPLY